jgi:hypothetical protein
MNLKYKTILHINIIKFLIIHVAINFIEIHIKNHGLIFLKMDS